MVSKPVVFEVFVVKSAQAVTQSIIAGPSGVRALQLAAGRNVGGHYKWHFFSFSLSFFLSSSLLILPEGFVIGFRNFA